MLNNIVMLGVSAMLFLSMLTAQAQQPFAAVPSEKGGQDIFGPYKVDADWPKDIATLPGHEGWTFGAGQGVFAESPDRVYYCSAASCRISPEPESRCCPSIGPSLSFPIGALARDAREPARQRRHGADRRGRYQTWIERGGRLGIDARWEHCILIFDGEGNIVDAWTQWDSMLQRPHFVAISPYDPEKHVWLLDDHKHVIFKFTHDGKTMVQTIGTYGEPGADETHFNRPTFLDWFPDGSFVVSDGYNGTRVVKFDKDGNYITSWGQKSDEQRRHAPRLLQQRARHRRRSRHGPHLRQRPRQPSRAGVRPERQVCRRVEVRRAPSDVHLFNIMSDGDLWAFDRGTEKMLKYELDGNFLYSWGTCGDFPGGLRGVHGISVDTTAISTSPRSTTAARRNSCPVPARIRPM